MAIVLVRHFMMDVVSVQMEIVAMMLILIKIVLVNVLVMLLKTIVEHVIMTAPMIVYKIVRVHGVALLF